MHGKEFLQQGSVTDVGSSLNEKVDFLHRFKCLNMSSGMDYFTWFVHAHGKSN